MEDRKNARSAILFVFLLCISMINILIRFLVKARNVIDKKDGDIGRLTTKSISYVPDGLLLEQQSATDSPPSPFSPFSIFIFYILVILIH